MCMGSPKVDRCSYGSDLCLRRHPMFSASELPRTQTRLAKVWAKRQVRLASPIEPETTKTSVWSPATREPDGCPRPADCPRGGASDRNEGRRKSYPDVASSAPPDALGKRDLSPYLSSRLTYHDTIPKVEEQARPASRSLGQDGVVHHRLPLLVVGGGGPRRREPQRTEGLASPVRRQRRC